MKRLCSILALGMIVISCGGQNLIQVQSPTATQSYLPLTPGIATTLEDDVLIDINSDARTKGIVVETNDEGIAIRGGFTSEVGTYAELVVEEQLYLNEDSGRVLLSRYETFMDDVDCMSPATAIIDFNPAIVLLEDTSEMAVGDVYTTHVVDVSYSGDIQNHNYIPSQTDLPDDLIDAEISVEVAESREITIGNQQVTAYRLVLLDMNMLPSAFIQSPFFTNMFSYSWMSFWLARGVGIVGLGNAFATSTTAAINGDF